jgi:predicted hydrocarbon binding protein
MLPIHSHNLRTQSNRPPVQNFVEKGIREILGEIQWNKVSRALNRDHQVSPGKSHPENNLPQLGKIIQGISEIYGEDAGLGLAQRAGGASFKYFLTEYANHLNLTCLEMRTKPLRSRLRDGMKSISACMSKEFGITATFEELKNELRWKVAGCSECSQRESVDSICFFTVGLIQEFLSWSAGSKFYPVEEIACSARGDPECEFRIGLYPLD